MSAFSVRSSWTGGLRGSGRLGGQSLDVVHSAPTELGGAGIGTNPEELLVSAAASCYLITLGAILERRALPFERIDLDSTVSVSASFVVESVVHRPRVHVRNPSNETLASIRDAAERAEKMCLVTNAMRGNVAVRIDVEITAVHSAA